MIPDFFIVGAPKAGTTALDFYLRQHPGIFMCAKEAHYFCTDFPGNVNFESFSEYQKLFDGAVAGQIVGEASVWYLYSEEAVCEITRLNPNAKFIAMLRDPVKAAQATHGELLLDLREDEPNFERAWRLQDARRRGERIPANAREPRQLLYRDVCSWSSQIQRLYRNAPEGNVKVIIMEEFFADPERGYREVLEFVGVENLLLRSFPRVNESKRVKHFWLLKLSSELPHRYPTTVRLIKHAANAVGLRPGKALYNYTKRGNITTKERREISATFKQELINEFKADVMKLEGILGRSLNDWWLR